MKKIAVLFLIWLAVLTAVWQVGLTPTVSNAFLQFYAAGVVPGTKIVLTPDQMFLLLGVTLALAAALIFLKEWRRLARALLRPKARAPEVVETSIPIESEVSEAADRPVVIITIPKRPGLVSRALSQMSPEWQRTFQMALVHGRARRAQGMRRVRAVAAEMWRLVRVYGKRAWRHAVVGLAAVAAYSLIGAEQLWRWCEPHCRRFDRYLNQRLHQNETTALLLAMGAQAGKLVRGWLAVCRNQYDRIFSSKSEEV
ncbi:MAG TPA: hypothetical protein VJP80_04695 [Candidatus Saccharimonadales bacterium]|nr:hypothetical protein [Candidatus Saccharimonadales bacterium]